MWRGALCDYRLIKQVPPADRHVIFALDATNNKTMEVDMYSRLALVAPLVMIAALLSFASGARADQADLDAEIERYAKVFSGTSYSAKKQALDVLAWAGISDPRVYDPIEAELLAGYQNADADKSRIDQMSWLAKGGLGVSGNSKYIATLEKLQAGPSKKLAKHAGTGIERIPKYAKWNPIISANLEQAPSGRLGQSRTMNLLASDIPELFRAGAKITRKNYSDDEEVLAAVNASLLANYDRNLSNKVQVDGVNHLIRTLGEAGNSTYRSTLDKVATSGNKKIAKYAKKYAGYL